MSTEVNRNWQTAPRLVYHSQSTVEEIDWKCLQPSLSVKQCRLRSKERGEPLACCVKNVDT